MNHDMMTIMQNEDIRKAFGVRLKKLRKQKKLTQKSWRRRLMYVIHN